MGPCCALRSVLRQDPIPELGFNSSVAPGTSSLGVAPGLKFCICVPGVAPGTTGRNPNPLKPPKRWGVKPSTFWKCFLVPWVSLDPQNIFLNTMPDLGWGMFQAAYLRVVTGSLRHTSSEARSRLVPVCGHHFW